MFAVEWLRQGVPVERDLHGGFDKLIEKDLALDAERAESGLMSPVDWQAMDFWSWGGRLSPQPLSALRKLESPPGSGPCPLSYLKEKLSEVKGN
jgi:hypothetical protein